MPAANARVRFPHQRSLQPHQHVAEPRRLRLGEVLVRRAVPADRDVVAEIVDGVVRPGPDPVNRRVRDERQLRADDRHRQRHVDSIGNPVGDRAGELVDGRADDVLGPDDVEAAAAQLEVVVSEHRRHLHEWNAVQVIERESLITEAERNAAAADRLAAVGEDRAEALRRSHERTGCVVEAICEARGGRREWYGRELRGEGDVDEPEVRLKRAVEVRPVRRPIELHVVAAHDEPVRSIDVFEKSGERRGQRLREHLRRPCQPHRCECHDKSLHRHNPQFCCLISHAGGRQTGSPR